MRLASLWDPRLAAIDAPLHEKLAAALAEDIADGRVAVGARLPPHRDLAYQLSVGLGSVTRAYDLLQKRGLVRSEHGRGMFVAGILQARADTIDLSVNMPPAVLAEGLLAATFHSLAGDVNVRTFSRYHPASGNFEHRQVVARWLTDHRLSVTPERMLLANGAQHALAVAINAACGVAGCLVTEEVGYPGGLTAARHMGVRTVAVELDGEGMLPSALDAALSRLPRGIRNPGVYVTPTLQNPTTAVMGEERRRDIVRVCVKHDVLIVEDDVYSAFGPRDLPAIAELAPERTLYVGGFSKIVSPGIRVGFLVPPPDLLDIALSGLQAVSSMISPVSCYIVAKWIVDGTISSLCASIIAESRSRVEVVKALFPRVITPEGGGSLHAWLPLPALEAERLVQRLTSEGVIVTPPRTVMADPDGERSGLRLCLGGPSKADLSRALEILRRSYEQATTPIRRTN